MKTKRPYYSFEDHKRKLFKDPEVREACENEFFKLKFAHQIAELREKANMTQAEFAVKIQSKQQVVSELESGRRMPSITMLLRVARAFNKKLDTKFV